MATIDIGPITVPAGDIADVQSALTAYYASNGIPNPTLAQILEYLRQDDIAKIKNITKQWRAAQVVVQDVAAT